MKAAFAVIAALWIASASQPALADCGDLTKRLHNVEVAGARTYLGNLPSGVRMARQQDMGGSGMDTLTGKVLNLDIQSAGVYYRTACTWSWRASTAEAKARLNRS